MNTPSNPAIVRIGKVVLELAGLALLVMLMRHFGSQENLKAALDWVAERGPWGPLLFVGIYVVAAIFLVPGSVLTLGAGAAFGVVRGSVIASVAATLGAAAAFLVGRHLARNAMVRRLGTRSQFQAIDRAVAMDGWRIVVLTRLSPVFPYALLNYAFGLTRVGFWPYVLASWLGMIPGTVMYVYLGSLAQVAAGDRSRTAGEWALYAVGGLATVLATVLITRSARKALAERTKDP